MPVMEEEKLLTVEDLARILGKSEETVKRLFRRKEIPGFKIGGHWYISRTAWKKHLEEQQNKK